MLAIFAIWNGINNDLTQWYNLFFKIHFCKIDNYIFGINLSWWWLRFFTDFFPFYSSFSSALYVSIHVHMREMYLWIFSHINVWTTWTERVTWLLGLHCVSEKDESYFFLLASYKASSASVPSLSTYLHPQRQTPPPTPLTAYLTQVNQIDIQVFANFVTSDTLSIIDSKSHLLSSTWQFYLKNIPQQLPSNDIDSNSSA